MKPEHCDNKLRRIEDCIKARQASKKSGAAHQPPWEIEGCVLAVLGERPMIKAATISSIPGTHSNDDDDTSDCKNHMLSLGVHLLLMLRALLKFTVCFTAFDSTKQSDAVVPSTSGTSAKNKDKLRCQPNHFDIALAYFKEQDHTKAAFLQDYVDEMHVYKRQMSLAKVCVTQELSVLLFCIALTVVHCCVTFCYQLAGASHEEVAHMGRDASDEKES